MPDAHLGHHRNRHRLHDFANHARSRHARHAAFFANVRRHALERHHRARAGVFRDLGLLGVGHVHNHAALQHLRQADFHPPQIIVHQFHVLSPYRSASEILTSIGFPARFAVDRCRPIAPAPSSTITNRPRPRASTLPCTIANLASDEKIASLHFHSRSLRRPNPHPRAPASNIR